MRSNLVDLVNNFLRLVSMAPSPKSKRPQPARRRHFQPLEYRIVLDAMAWTGGSGNWDDSSHWVDTTTAGSHSLPASGDTVTIDTGTTAATITIKSGDNLSVASVTTGGNDTLAITGGSLTATSATSTLSGPLSMTGGSLDVSGSGVSLSATGNSTMIGSNLSASGGASMILPALTTYTAPDYTTTLFEANGSGSRLSLPALTKFTGGNPGPYGSHAQIVAVAGGAVSLPALTQINGYDPLVETDGAGSVVDVSALTSFNGPVANAQLQVTKGGTLNDAKLTDLNGVNVTTDGSDPQLASAWTTFTGGSLAVTAGSLTLPTVSFSNANLTVSGGATLTLSSTSLATSGATTLEATGSGSTLSLPSLASLSVDLHNGSNTQIKALAGGNVGLPALANATGGPLALVSDGAGSVIDVSMLIHFNSVGSSVSQTNGGTITHPVLGSGGALTLNVPTSGVVTAATGINDWVFLGRAGQGITITVATQAIWPPNLNFAQVSLTDSKGNVLATASNTQSGGNASIAGFALPADGAYHILVQAPQAQAGATGDYVLTAADVTVHQFTLTVNQTVHGALDADSSVDHWTFSAAANTQMQFNLVAAANPATKFDLAGPNGFTAFSNATTSSSLITLPTAGSYVLTVHDAAGAYAFDLAQTSETDLALGTPVQANVTGNGQAQLFKITVTNPGPLLITLADPNSGDQNELYIAAGAPPTRDVFDARSVVAASANQALVVQARPGTYYVLVYDAVVQAAGAVTIEAQTAPFVVTDMTPTEEGNGLDTTVQFTGAFSVSLQGAGGQGVSGIQDSPSVQFVAADGSLLPATPIPLYYTGASDPNGLPVVAAALPAHTLPAGTYSVRITDNSGYSVTLPAPLTVVNGGVGVLQAQVIVPNPIGYHQSSTIYVKYTNVGTAPLAAPLLVLSAEQKGQEGAFLTLDPSLVTGGFVSDTTPAGYDQSVQFLASGATPGILQPGETATVPVYYGGWLHTQWDFARPPIVFSVGQLDTADTTAIDWPSLKAGLQLPTINQAAWDAVFPNLTAQMGSTWGSYLQTLDADARYLAGIGEPTTDLNKLLSFEIEKADAAYTTGTLVTVIDDSLPAPGLPLTFQRSFQQPIDGRYVTGIFGYGWTTNWDISAATDANGNAVVTSNGDVSYFTKRADGTYQPEAGDHSTLSFANGAYSMALVDGTFYQFNADGTLAYVQDTHANRITAGYTGGLLTSLTHSGGASFTLAYTAQGHVASITGSDGLTETYGYDATGQFLTTYTDRFGTTTYTYITGQSPQQNNALAEIAYADNTHIFFGYDPQGRLIDQHRDGGAEDEKFAYAAAGGYTLTDANGASSQTLFDLNGMTAETVNALGNVNRFVYDGGMNLVAIDGPDGTRVTNKYDGNGNLISTTDSAGNTTGFSYDSHNNLTSYTDAKNQTTRYGYSGANDLLSVTYADGSQQQLSYNPLGEATQYVSASGQPINSTYTSAGLVATERFADGSSFAYTYDARGNVLTAKAFDSAGTLTGTTTFSYTDPRNPDLLTEVQYPGGSFLKFTYNVDGQRTQSVDQTAFTVNYQYDPVGRLSKLTDGAGGLIAAYVYDPAGRLVEKDLGNGTYTIYGYDPAGNLLSLVNHAPRPAPGQDGPVNSQFLYTYDGRGLATTETTSDGKWTYSYDADGQLTHAVFTSNNPNTTPNQDLQYVYDPAGNRTQTVINGVTTQYTANSLNEYTQVGGTAYTYDQNGNLASATTGGVTTAYSFNQLNQLTGISTPANGPNPADASSFQYDPFGNRVGTIHNGQTTTDLIDPAGLGNVVAQFDGSGTQLAHYTYGLGLVSQVGTSGTGYYDFDLTGNTAGISGAAGSYVNGYTYLPFGQTTVVSAALANPFTFVGQAGVIADGSGLLDMRARAYTPETGRFLSADPLGLIGGDPNVRRYAINNPVTYIDPTGLSPYDTAQNGKCYNWRKGPYHPYYYVILDNGRSITTPQGTTISDVNDDIGNIYTKINYPNGDAYLLNGFSDIYTDNPPPAPSKGHGDPPNDPAGAGGAGGANCIPPPPPPPMPPKPPTKPAGADSTSAVTSEDPNSLLGPAGFGSAGFVSANTVLPYRINFENSPTATAPAQRVDISNQLDANLDPSTLQLTGIGWGDVNLIIPPNSQHFATTVSMTENGKTFDVDVTAGLDRATGLLTVSFQSIDPNTNLPPDLLAGFLPPDDSTPTTPGTGRGRGYVSYTIDAKSGAATGTQIHNIAYITFDQGVTIPTDLVNDEDPTSPIDPTKQALNTIDAVPPTSSVAALPATQSSTGFTVSWSGSDDAGGSGIADYNVFVSDNGGPVTAFQTNTAATSAPFTGVSGHTYAFYSVATDNVGNMQPTPTAAQATTTVSLVTVLPTSSVNALPATETSTSFVVSWSGGDDGGPGIASYDVYSSDNGGPFTVFQTGTTQASAMFTGANGHTYGFYSVATDTTGNRQATPTAAQATTTISAVTVVPTSSVTALPAFSEANFTVSWSGSDTGGPGIANYDVFVSDNGGAFTAWQTGTTNTSAAYQGKFGHTYGFYSVAVDSAGNRQPTPTAAQATTEALVKDANGQFVLSVYHDVLDRLADADGLAFWTQLLDTGTAVSSVAQSIAHSDEYYANFVIKPDYLSLLGRAADADGVKNWTTQMDAGLTDQQLEAGFVASDEFFNNAGGTTTAWIDAIYKLLLGRPADAAGETYWNGQLASGATRDDVALRIANSAENDTQLINDDYFHYLGRAADPDGLAFWLQQFADDKTNEDVISGFTGSAEYYKQHTG
jgi:RHS repeat-associated protein